GVGLSLSGGGYRAALFHAGELIRLNELGVLKRLHRISSVSGGSITSGILAQSWDRLTFTNRIATNFVGGVIAEILLDTPRPPDVRVSLEGFLPFVSAGNRLADLYDRYIFNGFKLRDMPKSPAFVFNSTNLQTGGLFRFARDYIADWRALMVKDH